MPTNKSRFGPAPLVQPTPGGSAGDGTIKGVLTVGPDTSGGEIDLIQGTTVRQLVKYISSGAFSFGDTATGDVPVQIFSGASYMYFDQIDPQTGVAFYFTTRDSGVDTNRFGITNLGKIGLFASETTAGMGVPPIYGLDNRTGLTSADSSAKTLYTTTAAGQVYRVSYSILGVSGTISSAVYTIGWTEDGTARTATASISASGENQTWTQIYQPDNDTAITAQLTTLSGTSPKVDVAAVLEQLA